MVFCYRHDGELVGYNICLEHGGMLIDKYIGLRYPQARELDLYFVSWFVNLEHALEPRPGASTWRAGPILKSKPASGRGLRSPGIWSGCATRSCAASCTCSGIGLSPTQRPWARRRLIRIRIMHDPRESFRPSPPVILDFDGSVLPVAEGERRIPLGSWQEAIRFGLHAPGVQCAGSPPGRRVACGLRLCVHGQRRFPPRHADPAAPPVPPPAARVP